MKIVIIIAVTALVVFLVSSIAFIVVAAQSIIEDRRFERLVNEERVKNAIERAAERIAEDNDEYNYGHQVNYENKSEES